MSDHATRIADALRPLAPDGKLFQEEIPLIDEIAELWRRRQQPRLVLPDGYFELLAQIESGNRPHVKAPTSSASGLYQFIRSTWRGEGGKWGADMSQAFGGLKPSIEEQRQRAESFTRKNAEYLLKQGIPLNKASLYAAHFFGPGTAAKVIAADVKERADLIAGPAATVANPSILRGKTVGQFLTWLHKKTGEWAR